MSGISVQSLLPSEEETQESVRSHTTTLPVCPPINNTGTTVSTTVNNDHHPELHKQPFRFLDLPAELRDIVYENLFTPPACFQPSQDKHTNERLCDEHRLTYPRNSIACPAGKHPQILRVNRQVGEEATQLLCSRSIFHARLPNGTKYVTFDQFDILNGISLAGCQNIRTTVISYDKATLGEFGEYGGYLCKFWRDLGVNCPRLTEARMRIEVGGNGRVDYGYFKGLVRLGGLKKVVVQVRSTGERSAEHACVQRVGLVQFIEYMRHCEGKGFERWRSARNAEWRFRALYTNLPNAHGTPSPVISPCSFCCTPANE